MRVANEHIISFLLGGKCECIIRNINTNNSFKFQIKSNTESSGGNMYFVYTYVDGKSVYAGFIGGKKREYTYTQGKKGVLSENEIEIKALMYVLKNAHKLPDNVEVLHVGKCSRCGRKLTNPDSINIGVGPECIKKINKKVGVE